VIHTVGPVWRGGGNDEDELLASCYRISLALAGAHQLASIALPAISTGVYGFPADRAAGIAVSTVITALPDTAGLAHVVFCCFDRRAAEHYEAAFRVQGLLSPGSMG
jgi:O-acetyl-ADP-ribose deacetylase